MTAEKVSIVVGSEPVELPESNGKHPGLTSLEIFYCAAERRLEETNPKFLHRGRWLLSERAPVEQSI